MSSKTATMPTAAYIEAYEGLNKIFAEREAFDVLEADHLDEYGVHKCSNYNSFRAIKSRYYRKQRERLRERIKAKKKR